MLEEGGLTWVSGKACAAKTPSRVSGLGPSGQRDGLKGNGWEHTCGALGKLQL